MSHCQQGRRNNMAGIACGLMLLFCLPQIAAARADIAQQRQWFDQARQALAAGQIDRFEALASKLQDYPLYPYLRIWQARADMKQGLDASVERTLQQYPEIPETMDLRLEWIRNLAERGQWPHVAEQMSKLPGIGKRMPEIALVALWRTGHKDEALRRFGERWQRGARTGELAWRLEMAWRQAGHPSMQEAVRRLAALGKAGRWQEVSALKDELGKDVELSWLEHWRAMQIHPEALIRAWPHTVPKIVAGMVFEDVLHRLARQDVGLAWKALHRHRLLAGKRLHALEKRIALRAAKRHEPQALKWLASLPGKWRDAETRAWQARLYLLAQDYPGLLRVIRNMPAEQGKKSRWQFWRARALEETGHRQQAARLYRELAGERGYYSFLAAERLGQPYRMGATEFEAEAATRSRLSAHPAMQRAHEWWLKADATRANREWYLAMAGADAEGWKAAAALALDWQWYDRMIYAAYRAGEKDALSLRFPRGFAESVQALARTTGLDASLIWSVIRQESAFNRNAVSRSGARGLMQLMPATARHVASRNDVRVSADELFEPETNIRLGAFYLAELNERFAGNVALMTAAYNAGPSRVSRWLEQTPFVHPAAWVEAIPFNETRRYVQQVLAFMVVYDWLQAREPGPMSDYLASNRDSGQQQAGTLLN